VVERWSVLEPELDFEPYLVTGRVARIATHLARHQEEVFGRYGLNRGEVGVLSALRIVGPPHRLSPTKLFKGLMLSSAGMTSRLDRLEERGLVKRSSDKSLFFWAMAAVGLIGLAVPGVAFAVFDGFTWTMLGFALISVCFHASYAVTLTRSYRLGDLSSVYPISRGMGPALVPVLAVLLLGESISAVAVIGIAAAQRFYVKSPDISDQLARERATVDRDVRVRRAPRAAQIARTSSRWCGRPGEIAPRCAIL